MRKLFSCSPKSYNVFLAITWPRGSDDNVPRSVGRNKSQQTNRTFNLSNQYERQKHITQFENIKALRLPDVTNPVLPVDFRKCLG